MLGLGQVNALSVYVLPLGNCQFRKRATTTNSRTKGTTTTMEGEGQGRSNNKKVMLGYYARLNRLLTWLIELYSPPSRSTPTLPPPSFSPPLSAFCPAPSLLLFLLSTFLSPAKYLQSRQVEVEVVAGGSSNFVVAALVMNKRERRRMARPALPQQQQQHTTTTTRTAAATVVWHFWHAKTCAYSIFN